MERTRRTAAGESLGKPTPQPPARTTRVRTSTPGKVPMEVVRGRAAPPAEGVYVISVAARLLSMHPQTLRKYERVGLISPSRTVGLLRLYSEQDVARLRMVKHLVDDWGMNLAGVEVAMNLLESMLTMHRRLLPLIRSNDDAQALFQEVWERTLEALRLPGPFSERDLTGNAD